MPKFPEPPDVGQLAAIGPELKILPVGTELWRIYFRSGAHPTLWNQFRAWGPTASRFDHHPPPARLHPDRSIIYAAATGPTALAEVFQSTRVIDRVRHDPWLVAFRLAKAVTLLDLTGAWPTRAGASMNLNSGPRPRARRWSQRIHEAYPAVEGLHYPSSMHANLVAVAVYERGVAALPRTPSFHAPLVQPSLLAVLEHAAARLGYGLV